MSSAIETERSGNLVGEARYVLIYRLVMPASAFALLVAIGRNSDQMLGEYAVVTTYYFVLQTLPLLGLTPLVMREIARTPERAGAYFSTIGLLAVAACALINTGLHHLPKAFGYSAEIADSIAVVGLSIFGGILAFLAETVLITLHQARRVAVVSTLENVARLAVSIGLLTSGGSVADLMRVVLVLRVLVLVVHLPALVRHTGCWYVALPQFKLLRNTLPLVPSFLASTILALVISRFDFLVLSIFESAEQIGHYAIAYRALEICLLGITAFGLAVFARLARLYAFQRARFGITVSLTLRLTITAVICLAILGSGLADAYVAVLFARQSPDASWLARLFMLTFAAAAIDQLMSTVLNAADRQTLDLRALAAGGAIYVVSLLALVPSLHLLGAWIATCATLAIQMSIRSAALRAEFGLAILELRELKFVLLALFPAAAYFWLAPHAPIANAIAGAILAIYAGGVLAASGIPRIGSFLANWHPRCRVSRYVEHPVWGELIHLIAHDAASSERHGDPDSRRGFTAVLLYRIAHHAHRHNRKLAARLLWQINLALFKIDIPPHVVAGPGLLIPRPEGVVLSGRIGRDVVVGAGVGLGFHGHIDVGAGPGIPVVGDEVILDAGSGVLGGIRIPPRSRIPAGAEISSVRSLRRALADLGDDRV